MPARYVRPYVKRNKNDAADAEAICEAVTRPSMRFVPIKGTEQQSVLLLHRARELLVRQRTMLINALRGHLAEFGIVRAQGRTKASELMQLIEDASDDVLPAKIRDQLRHPVEPLRDLHRRLAEIDRELGEFAREHPAARRLATIPGVGPVTATALVAAIGDGGRFRSGRHLAAYLGLVPKQCGSGGKEQSGAISKRGGGYLRMLLTHGARAVVRIRGAGPRSAAGEWIGRLLQRRPVNVVVLAQPTRRLGSPLDRLLPAAPAATDRARRVRWAVLTKGEGYGRPAAAVA